MERYRILRQNGIYYLQFEYTRRLLWLSWEVWKFIPNDRVARVSRKSGCPTYLPFTTSHCYLAFLSKKEAIEWADNNKSLDPHLASLELRIKAHHTNAITYL